MNSCIFWLWSVWHTLTVFVHQIDRNLMAIFQVKWLPLPTSHISSRSWKSYQDFQCWRYGASSKPLLLNLYPSLLSHHLRDSTVNSFPSPAPLPLTNPGPHQMLLLSKPSEKWKVKTSSSFQNQLEIPVLIFVWSFAFIFQMIWVWQNPFG